jgi:hypothetical protein
LTEQADRERSVADRDAAVAAREERIREALRALP